ncbi:MAG: hypothetical protein COU29_02115 [Candidatus Magasanikbacteria bacterium CG10_big_fil_rev_8_21_14_0_10_36_32]|uniref:Uncharacterized protein n=1 Tax=Candidatus Magasanikbacteria bacterium CG10_big_fil_rev_8_21_14_0_10_36_32 TaxID=1974646 RepID=A0A2M6W701_9BACT|nr:MAG: hypothetical protein COU29_02115 [Candidatus Magasanikbacteria bacterium CG10_big_fil_rev_8_21_14_0_10_36_32]
MKETRIKKNILTRSFADLLAICKQTSCHNINFNEKNFPLEPIDDGEDEWEVCEFHFDKNIKETSALIKLTKNGYRLCGPRRAMEFIANNPNIQFNHPLILTTCWKRKTTNSWSYTNIQPTLR